MNNITLIIPYYRAPLMLMKQLQAIRDYPGLLRVIVVDDCSSESAEEVIAGWKRSNFSLYRIDTSIPWNREGARNLGATLATTPWIIQVDTDHVLQPKCAELLMTCPIEKKVWYRFPRYRIGKADETRKKDTIPEDQEYGRIKPHIDSYLCTKDMYWAAGGYNEDFVGFLGGGGQFLKMMKRIAGEPELMPDDIFLEVYTRHAIPDASVSDLSRDKTKFKERRRKIGLVKAQNPLRFKWHQIQ